MVNGDTMVDNKIKELLQKGSLDSIKWNVFLFKYNNEEITDANNQRVMKELVKALSKYLNKNAKVKKVESIRINGSTNNEARIISFIKRLVFKKSEIDKYIIYVKIPNNFLLQKIIIEYFKISDNKRAILISFKFDLGKQIVKIKGSDEYTIELLDRLAESIASNNTPSKVKKEIYTYMERVEIYPEKISKENDRINKLKEISLTRAVRISAFFLPKIDGKEVSLEGIKRANVKEYGKRYLKVLELVCDSFPKGFHISKAIIETEVKGVSSSRELRKLDKKTCIRALEKEISGLQQKEKLISIYLVMDVLSKKNDLTIKVAHNMIEKRGDLVIIGLEYDTDKESQASTKRVYKYIDSLTNKTGAKLIQIRFRSLSENKVADKEDIVRAILEADKALGEMQKKDN